jgi:hypothetical protein
MILYVNYWKVCYEVKIHTNMSLSYCTILALKNILYFLVGHIVVIYVNTL